MEETLQLILKELTSIKEGQATLNSEVSSIKEELKGVNIRLDKVEDVQAEIKTDVKEINRKASVVFEQTAGLTEFTTSTTGSLQRIEEELNAVETVTAKNCFDITRLKAIK